MILRSPILAMTDLNLLSSACHDGIGSPDYIAYAGQLCSGIGTVASCVLAAGGVKNLASDGGYPVRRIRPHSVQDR